MTVIHAHDPVKITGHGIVEVFDAEKLSWAIDRGKVRTYIRGDGSIRDLVTAVRHRQLPKRALLHPREVLSRENPNRPSLWVPMHELKALAGLKADDTLDFGYNLFLTAGVTRLWANLNAVPASTAVLDATHCRLIAGDGTTAVTAADTTLTGSTNKWAQILDGAPSASTNQTSRTATFPTGQGNFVWNKWGMDNGTSSAGTAASATIEVAPLFNAAVASLGTKTSAAAWAFTATHSIS